MALTLSQQRKEFEGTITNTLASNGFNTLNDDLILALFATNVGNTVMPEPALSNNKGLTFTKRYTGQAGPNGGNSYRIGYWWARSVGAQTGLIVQVNESNTYNNRAALITMQVRGIKDWGAPFDPVQSPILSTYLHPSVRGPVPTATANQSKSSALKLFYWFSSYPDTPAGGPNVSVAFNVTTPGVYFRHCLGYDINNASSLTGTYNETSYAAMSFADTINGDSPTAQPQSRPIVILTG